MGIKDGYTHRAIMGGYATRPGRGELEPAGGQFRPLCALWEGRGALYSSEAAARGALEQLRPALAAAGAIGLHLGLVYVNPAKFADVARAHAPASPKMTATR